MKRQLITLSLLLSLTAACYAVVSAPIVYNGDTLKLNYDFRRTKTGMSPSAHPEISGLSCSRITPGFLWSQSDDNSHVVAITTSGTIRYDLHLTNRPSRSDWEDMCSGLWGDSWTLFIGAFGDNNRQYNDRYYIFYFDEPAIPDTKTQEDLPIGDKYILYGYPDSVAHDAEAMLFDNPTQTLYIIDKVDRTCASVYALPMDTIYGHDLVRLEKVAQLGLPGEWQFQRVTGADITPDGRWICIKNYDVVLDRAYALLWERHDGETVPEALGRQPQQIAAYELEWQGEAVAWLDSTTFYTTSDEDGSAPIYRYTRWIDDTALLLPSAERSADKIIRDGQVFIRRDDTLYTTLGQEVKQ